MLIEDSNLLAFAAGLIVGLIVGLVLGVHFGIKYSRDNQSIQRANILGAVFAMLWAGLHTYAILTGDIEVPLFFDVVGGLAMGQTLGIDLASAIQKMRK